MKRMKEMHHYDRSNRIGWMVWPICIVLAVMGSFLLIDTIAIDDVNEAASSRHIGNIPVGVTKLSADSYLIEDSAKVTPFDICKGSNAEGSGAKESRRIEPLDSSYVECWLNQKWNYVERRDNPDFFEAFMIAVQKQWVLLGVAAIIITLIFPLIVGLRELGGAIAERHQSRKERKSTYDSQLARYKAIQAAYARDEINDLEFDKKLQTLVDDGFTLPDSGIFEKKT